MCKMAKFIKDFEEKTVDEFTKVILQDSDSIGLFSMEVLCVFIKNKLKEKIKSDIIDDVLTLNAELKKVLNEIVNELVEIEKIKNEIDELKSGDKNGNYI